MISMVDDLVARGGRGLDARFRGEDGLPDGVTAGELFQKFPRAPLKLLGFGGGVLGRVHASCRGRGNRGATTRATLVVAPTK